MKPSQICLLVLAAACVAASLFGVPASVAPQLAVLPSATLLLVGVAVGLSAFAGWRSLLLAAAVGVLAAPLVQPVLTPLALLAAGATAVALSRRQGWTGMPKTAGVFFAGCAVYATALMLAVCLLPVLHAVSLPLVNFSNVLLCVLVASVATVVASPGLRDRVGLNPIPEGARVRQIAGWSAVGFFWLTAIYCLLVNNSTWIQTVQMRESMEIEDVDVAGVRPISSRLQPLDSANTAVHGLNGSAWREAEVPHLQLRPDGTLWWQSPLQNMNRWGRIFGSVSEVVVLDANDTDEQLQHHPNASFLWGDKSWVTQAVFSLRHPGSEIVDSGLYLNADETWSYLITYKTKKPTFCFPFPLTMVDSFGGVMELTQSGLFRDYTPAQAAKRFAGAVLAPTRLTRAYAEAYAQYRNGLWGTYVVQDASAVLEISEDLKPDALGNPQPYVQQIDKLGLQEIVFLEAKGKTQFALKEILMADALTGKFSRVIVPEGHIGPRMAISYVRPSDRNMDWSHIAKVEPLWVVVPRTDGKPDRHFYQISCVLDDKRNIEQGRPVFHTYQVSVLVDARRPTVSYPFKTKAELDRLLRDLAAGKDETDPNFNAQFSLTPTGNPASK